MSLEELDRLNELYKKFRYDLKHADISSLYYDEDDIIDIFDYAGDVRDDNVRLNAMMLGFKLFPDSTDMIKRQAIFLSEINDQSFGQFIIDNNRRPIHDFMWEILRCKAFGQASDITDRLKALLDNYSLEEDEEIIQFVGIAHKYGCEQWLSDNLDFIKSRCRYPDTLFYEIARSAESPEQMAFGVKLLEQLTDEDPFNSDYWGLMADIQSALGRYDEALSSLDYVKALNADDRDIYSLQGYILLQLERPEDAIAPLEKSHEMNPDNEPSTRNLLQAYKLTGNKEKMKPIVKDIFESDPTDSDIFVEMMSLFPERLEETLQRFHSTPSEHDEQSTVQRVGQLCASGYTATALDYLQWYTGRFPITQQTKLALLELLYLSQNYHEAYLFLDNNFNELQLVPSELPYIGLISSILIREGKLEDAVRFIDLWLDNIRELKNPNYVISLISSGLAQSLTRMKETIDGAGSLDRETIERITC